MGCCNLKKQNKKISKASYILRKTFFYAVHLFFIFALFFASLFRKKYRKIYSFYLSYFWDVKKEIQIIRIHTPILLLPLSSFFLFPAGFSVPNQKSRHAFLCRMQEADWFWLFWLFDMQFHHNFLLYEKTPSSFFGCHSGSLSGSPRLLRGEIFCTISRLLESSDQTLY